MKTGEMNVYGAGRCGGKSSLADIFKEAIGDINLLSDTEFLTTASRMGYKVEGNSLVEAIFVWPDSTWRYACEYDPIEDAWKGNDWSMVLVPTDYEYEMIDKVAEQHCQGLDVFRVDLNDFKDNV